MQGIIDFFMAMQWMEWVIAIESLMASLIMLFMLIPGDQPEKTLQKILDIMSKFSKKK